MCSFLSQNMLFKARFAHSKATSAHFKYRSISFIDIHAHFKARYAHFKARILLFSKQLFSVSNWTPNRSTDFSGKPFHFNYSCNFSQEGRTWYTRHHGRLWIAATAKAPDHGT